MSINNSAYLLQLIHLAISAHGFSMLPIIYEQLPQGMSVSPLPSHWATLGNFSRSPANKLSVAASVIGRKKGCLIIRDTIGDTLYIQLDFIF